MAKKTLLEMIAGLYDLSVDELTQLNKQLIAIARQKQRAVRQVAASEVIGDFRIGDVVSFFKEGRSKNAGLNFFIFKNMNRAGDCMQGPSCDEDGKPLPVVTTWTVTATQPSLKVVMRQGKKVS